MNWFSLNHERVIRYYHFSTNNHSNETLTDGIDDIEATLGGVGVAGAPVPVAIGVVKAGSGRGAKPLVLSCRRCCNSCWMSRLIFAWASATDVLWLCSWVLMILLIVLFNCGFRLFRPCMSESGVKPKKEVNYTFVVIILGFRIKSIIIFWQEGRLWHHVVTWTHCHTFYESTNHIQ